MESVKEVKDALSARSRTATLDELRSEGRKRVRLIKAEHVAAMITEAVHSAIEQSGLIPKEEVDRLVESSRKEFKDILHEREQEAQAAHDLKEQYAEQQVELERLQGDLAAAQQELEQLRAAPAPSSGSPEMMMMMMQELSSLKASMMVKDQQPAAAGGPDLTAALEKLSGTLNDRLETLGRKMGISGAVEGDAVKFDGLFRDDDKPLESNLDNVQVKQKAGGGIAANLARLKKLKGGG